MDGNEDFEEPEHVQPKKVKRTSKSSAKKAAMDKENESAEAKKEIARLKQQVRQLTGQTKAKRIDDSDDEEEDEGHESEEETYISGFSSAIRPLGPSSIASNTPHTNRTPLKRVGAAAARMPTQAARTSRNAFKGLPAPPVEPEDNNENLIFSDSPEVMQGTRPHGSSPPPSDELCGGSSSPCVAHVNTSGTRRPRSASLTLAGGVSTSAAKKAKVVVKEMFDELMPTYREGAEVNPKKPKASDFIDVVHALILRAAAEYETLVSTKDAFPETATRNKWAKVCWKNAGLVACERYTLTDPINVLLWSRGSRIRGYAVAAIRPLIISLLGFKRGGDSKTVTANVSLFSMLKKKAAFHFKDPATLTGFAQGRIISAVLHAVWFEEKNSPGVVFESFFNPIPLETLALILTIVDFCLDEWSTGNFCKAILWEKDVVERHRVFRLDLEQWNKLNEVAVLGHRKKLYRRALCHAGINEGSKVQQSLIGEALDRARDELAGRTGETDSEAED